MHTLLLLTVVLFSVLGPAAAASPIMDPAMPGAPMEFTDLEGMLCTACAIPFYQCVHAMPQAPYIAAQWLNADNQPQQSLTLVEDPYMNETDLQPLFQYVAEATHQPLADAIMQFINEDETSVQPETVQAHIEDTYTPGDRVVRRPRSRRSPQRRQAPRPGGGYSCEVDGCGRSFDRACELNRHQKTHLNRFERPHKCSACGEGFLYPKDLHRHERKHVGQRAEQVTFFCHYPGCGNSEGFSRRDNLLRHQRKQHEAFVTAH